MLAFAVDLAQKAGAYIRDHTRDDLVVEHKGRIDLVTAVDKGSQELIARSIRERFPEHGILAEEGLDQRSSSGYTWIVDPLDGTTNFVHGLPLYNVSIALYHDDRPLVGVVYNPAADDLFAAEKGKGATRNGRPIHVSPASALVDALVVTGFPYRAQNLPIIIERFFRVLSQAQGVRRLGAAALDLCYTACGHFDAFWEEHLAPWDMAAGALILSEAGGTATLIDGSPYTPHGGTILGTNTLLHDLLLGLM